MAKTKAPAKGPKLSKALEKKTASTNNYLALMALICVMVIGITLYVALNLGKTAYMQTRLIAKKVDVQNKYDDKITNATELIDEYHGLGQRRVLIEHAIPNTPDFPQIVSLIEFAATSAGVNVKAINPDTVAQQASDVTQQSTGAAAVPVSFSIEVQGSYEKILGLLKNMELSVRPLRVTAAEFKGNDEVLRVTLQVETAYQVKTDLTDPIKELQ